jgi:hypothetical protein
VDPEHCLVPAPGPDLDGTAVKVSKMMEKGRGSGRKEEVIEVT